MYFCVDECWLSDEENCQNIFSQMPQIMFESQGILLTHGEFLLRIQIQTRKFVSNISMAGTPKIQIHR